MLVYSEQTCTVIRLWNLWKDRRNCVFTQARFLSVPPLPEVLMITDFRNLHGQLQTVACILAGAEQTAVQVNAGVVVSARSRLRRGLHVCVAGAAVVGASLTGSRKEENQIVEAAEEAAQDHLCTVGCGRQRTFRRCESHQASLADQWWRIHRLQCSLSLESLSDGVSG